MNRILTALAICLAFAPQAGAQSLFDYMFPEKTERKKEKAVSITYDTNFEYYFDNREYDNSGNLYTRSMTINSARLSPSVGVRVAQDKNVTHRVMLGADILKNMGEYPTSELDEDIESTGMFRYITMYYNIRAKTARNTMINGYAGVFPRYFTMGDYGEAFISDSLEYYDNNLEGILAQIIRPHSIYELGMDWMGMYGSHRRERFMVFSYGESALTGWFSLGWMCSAYHLANTLEYRGVVDNFMVIPFVKFDLEAYMPLQELSFKLSAIQSLQRDRLLEEGFIFPAGGQLELSLMKWNVGIHNITYIGTSLMPYYNDYDAGGNKYGSGLYRGDPFYRIHPAGSGKAWNEIGMYDRLELFWQPYICDFLNLKLSIVSHFAEGKNGKTGLAGTQQKFSLVFNLERLLDGSNEMSPRQKASRTKHKSKEGIRYPGGGLYL